MEVVGVVVGRVVDVLFAQVGHQISYLIRYKRNVDDLKRKVEDLKGARERMQVRIDAATGKGEDVETDVQAWISSVDNIVSEAETFLLGEDAAAMKIACFNMRSRHRSSKKALRKSSSVFELHERGEKFGTVSHAPPPCGINAYSNKNIAAYESQKSCLKEIMNALEEEHTQIVGVCGIGGVGKTTLVTELGKQVKASKKFDDVIMVAVSQTINIMKIQDDLAGLLGMDKLPDDESRRGMLWSRLCKGNKVLVILDDVWRKLDLDELGVPSGINDHPHIKIVVTSRNINVCNDMDSQKIICVDPMPGEEAWSLFKQVAGEVVERDQEIKAIAEDVARECKGLPIAILAVGRALRKKRKIEWVDAFHQLHKVAPPSVNPMLRDVFPKLVLSYNFLESEESKQCFLLCCMFPEDYNIPVESLAQYGLGLKFFQHIGTSLEDARRGARNAVSNLKQSHLLLSGHDEFLSSVDDDNYVRMHDVVRDVAIAITSQDENNTFLVEAGKGLTILPDVDTFDKYTGISLMENNICELSPGLKCPALQTLLLHGNNSLKLIHDAFFQEMKMLKVLDLRQCKNITSLPRSLLFCSTLRTLRLDYSGVDDISVLQGLIELEILSLSGTPIIQIPKEIGRLINLRLLDIRKCRKLSRIAPGVISSFHKLEGLYIGYSFTKWDVEEEDNRTKNASITELHSLQRLTSLDIVVLSLNPLLSNLQFKDLEYFNITIRNEPHFFWSAPYIKRKIFSNDEIFSDYEIFSKDEYPRFCLLDIRDMNISMWGWIKMLMKKADILRMNSFMNVSGIITDIKDVDFNNLRDLELSECDNVSCLPDMVNFDSPSAFSNLKKLRLTGLQNLTQIFHDQLHPTGGSFMKLREIIISNCPKISVALEFNLLSRLGNLTTLCVEECGSLEYIIGRRPKSYKDVETKFLPMLGKLDLFSLPKLVAICDDQTYQFVCLSNIRSLNLSYCGKIRKVFSTAMVRDLVCLEWVVISVCGSLEHIFEPLEVELMGIQSMHESSSLQKLCTVSMRRCNRVRYVFSSSIAKLLSQLKCLSIIFCDDIEAIIGVDENIKETNQASTSTTHKTVTLLSLSDINLLGLNKLKSFSLKHCKMMEYPSLVSLKIWECENMERWGYGIQLTPNLKQERIRDQSGVVRLRSGDHGMELLISNKASMGGMSHDS